MRPFRGELQLALSVLFLSDVPTFKRSDAALPA